MSCFERPVEIRRFDALLLTMLPISRPAEARGRRIVLWALRPNGALDPYCLVSRVVSLRPEPLPVSGYIPKLGSIMFSRPRRVGRGPFFRA